MIWWRCSKTQVKVKTQSSSSLPTPRAIFMPTAFMIRWLARQVAFPPSPSGVYAVATPAGRVAGGGKWLTSDTDKIIADLVAMFPLKK